MEIVVVAARAFSLLEAIRRREEGQALVEYALILFLVALVVIGILGTLGGAVSSMFSVVNSEF
jgi:pilus assembly protein Flp/PilA